MNIELQDKIDRTLGFLEKDRQVPHDPFFMTRLEARTEACFSCGTDRSAVRRFSVRWQPVFAVAAIVVGLFAGVLSGSLLSRTKTREPVSERSVQLERFASEAFISEISSPVEEQLLSK